MNAAEPVLPGGQQALGDGPGAGPGVGGHLEVAEAGATLVVEGGDGIDEGYALVVDIGGFLSHAAIVARELGIPCVVNTMHGSRTIKTGDRIRVDGNAGTVEILERAVA